MNLFGGWQEVRTGDTSIMILLRLRIVLPVPKYPYTRVKSCQSELLVEEDENQFWAWMDLISSGA